VTVLANAYFTALVNNAGLTFCELGKADSQVQTMNHPHLYDRKKGFDVFSRGLIQPIIPPTLSEILARTCPGKTVVLASRFAFGAQLAREKLHIPVITLALTPHALAKGRAISFFSPDGIIGLFPAWFAKPTRPWPPHVRLTGFPLDSPVGSEPMPPSLEAFLASGNPPVVFTPGTAMRHADLFFRESMKVCLQSGIRGIFVTPFDEQIPKKMPSGILHIRSAPFGTLFLRAKALVHSGGIGTSAQAMACGIPQLVIPLAFDQFDNASRLKKLGVALTLDPKEYRANAIAKHLRKLMTSGLVSKWCVSVAKEFKTDNPVLKACDIIETYENRPV